MLPQDPIILLSYVNTKLRDEYDTLEQFCAELETDRAALEARLKESGFVYDPDRNQFR